MSRRSVRLPGSVPARAGAPISTRAHAVLDYALPLGIAAMATRRRFGWPVRAIMSIGPVWHLGYTLLTRYEGGGGARLAGPAAIGMRAHLACDAAGALSFLGAGVLMRRQRASHRLLLAAIGLGELAVIALTDRRPQAQSFQAGPAGGRGRGRDSV